MEGLSKIGIDLWGMLLYFINYGLLLGVLGYYFYPKIIEYMDKRRETIKKNIEETNRLQKELEEKLAKSAAEADEMKAEFARERESLKKELEEKRSSMMKEMEEERDKMMTEAKELLRKKRESIISDAEAQVLTTMKKVLLHVTREDVPEDTIEKSVHGAWKHYKDL